MKIQSWVSNGLVVVSFLASTVANSAVAQDGNQSKFWPEIRALVQRCTVQASNHLRSVCSELQVQGSEAYFLLDGKPYIAAIVDSADSDGGDLNDIFVRDAGQDIVGVRRNIPAFGDILLGLAGGQVQLEETHEVPNLQNDGPAAQ